MQIYTPTAIPEQHLHCLRNKKVSAEHAATAASAAAAAAAAAAVASAASVT
jgi:hypothetical protein